MNGENWVEIETTEMRKIWRKWRKRNWRIRKENAGSEMEEKQRRGITSSNKRNSGVTGGGCGQGAECPPETSDREISADLPEKKRQGKNGKGVKIEKKRRKIIKGKVQNWKWKVEKLQNKRTFFCFCFVCLFVWWVVCFCFCFVLFVCFCFCFVLFVCLFAFSRREKKTGKMTLPPQKNFPVSTLKRKGEKCKGLLRKSLQWCNWDMKRKRRVSMKKKKWKRREKRKRGRNSGNWKATDDFKWSQANEWGKLY